MPYSSIHCNIHLRRDFQALKQALALLPAISDPLLSLDFKPIYFVNPSPPHRRGSGCPGRPPASPYLFFPFFLRLVDSVQFCQHGLASPHSVVLTTASLSHRFHLLFPKPKFPNFDLFSCCSCEALAWISWCSWMEDVQGEREERKKFQQTL